MAEAKEKISYEEIAYTIVNEVIQKANQEIAETQQILKILKIILIDPEVKIHFFLKENKILKEQYYLKNKKIKKLESIQDKSFEEEDELEDMKKQDEINNLEEEKLEIMNKISENLEFYTYINGIKYEFLFTKSKISMTNTSTNTIIEIPYNIYICHFVVDFSLIHYRCNNFYIKNYNYLSIANFMLKNINIPLFNYFVEYNKIYEKTSIEFIKAICESGNKQYNDLFVYFLENNFLNDCRINDLYAIFSSACFGGNFEIIHSLKDFIEKKGYTIDYSFLFGAVAGNNLDVIENLLLQLNCKLDKNRVISYIIESFNYIRYPKLALCFLDKNYIENNFCVTINDNLLDSYYFLSKVILKAIENTHLEVVEILLEKAKSRNINMKEFIDKKNWELFAAVNQENIEKIQLLLQDPEINVNAQFSINKHKDFEKSPLVLAIEKRNIEIVELLLQDPKTDVNIKLYKNFSEEFSPLDLAIRKKNLEIVELLLQRSEIDVNFNSILYNLASGIKYNKVKITSIRIHREIIKLLLQHPNIKIDRSEYCILKDIFEIDELNNCEKIRLERKRNSNIKSSPCLIF